MIQPPAWCVVAVRSHEPAPSLAWHLLGLEHTKIAGQISGCGLLHSHHHCRRKSSCFNLEPHPSGPLSPPFCLRPPSAFFFIAAGDVQALRTPRLRRDPSSAGCLNHVQRRSSPASLRRHARAVAVVADAAHRSGAGALGRVAAHHRLVLFVRRRRQQR